jgi:hypothetical protein
MKGGVVAIFGPWEPLKPLSWLITSEAVEVRRDHLVRCFLLAVGMGMKCRREVELDAGEGEQLLPELAGEDRISVADDGAQQAM